MPAPGPLNALTDIAGLRVGQAQDADVLTGVTVILPDAPVLAVADIRGGGTGTRETALLEPGATVKHVTALVLSGGSALGLDAAGAVALWLRERGRGFEVAGQRVPIVPAAILFDLGRGTPADPPPWRGLARAACEAASAGPVAQGLAGAGMGAKAGALKGGTGTASLVADGVTVAALAVANPLGSVVMPDGVTPYAWYLERDGEFGGIAPPGPQPDAGPDLPASPANTTLAVVGTDAALDRSALHRMAIMAQAGLARAIRPAHGPLDGDIVFAISTCRTPFDATPQGLARLGAHAADCVARAITRGVTEAGPAGGWPAWRDRRG